MSAASTELNRSSLQKTVICSRAVARNLRTWLRTSAGWIGGDSGSTHRGSSVEESVRYIQLVFEDYFRYSSVTRERVAGMRVLEVGPGDSMGVALLLIAAGARQIIGIDAFDSVRDDEHHRRVAAALRETLDGEARSRFDAACHPETGALDPKRVACRTGVPLEAAAEQFEQASFDWILSRAVLEETRDPAESIAVMDRLLRPGGVLTHKIDLRDYGLFSGRGFHPLEFRTIPDRLYALMSRHTWIPNRQPASAYTEPLERLGYEVRTRVTHLTGVENELLPHPHKIPEGPDAEAARALVHEIRPRLVKPFRDLPDQDLMTAGVFLDAVKPA